MDEELPINFFVIPNMGNEIRDVFLQETDDTINHPCLQC